MKKLFALLIALFAISFVSLSAIADTIEKETGFISVNESTTKEVSPNQAEISFAIETSDKSLKKASEDNKTIAGGVYSALKQILGTNEEIKTSNYSAKPQYTYTKDNKKILDKYIVTNSIAIKTKKIELVPKLIDTAISQGATNVNNLQFSSTDYDNNCNDILAELTKKTYSQTNAVAKSINAQIIGIKSINATCNQETNPRSVYAMMAKGSMDGGSATPIESGKVKIYANVDASFYVK